MNKNVFTYVSNNAGMQCNGKYVHAHLMHCMNVHISLHRCSKCSILLCTHQMSSTLPQLLCCSSTASTVQLFMNCSNCAASFYQKLIQDFTQLSWPAPVLHYHQPLSTKVSICFFLTNFLSKYDKNCKCLNVYIPYIYCVHKRHGFSPH